MKSAIISSILATAVTTSAFANTSQAKITTNTPDIAVITKQLQKVIPHVKVAGVTQSPIPGLYEVDAGNNVFYTTKDARYAIYGHLIDLKNAEPVSLTEESLKKFRVKVLSSVDPKSMIIYAPQDNQVKRTITVFTDIDCAYCRKFHQEIPELNKAGIAVRYVAFPRSGIGSESYNKAVAVWCADDSKAAMTAAKTGHSVPLKAGCDKSDVISKHIQLVNELNLQATPVIFLEDGTEIPGYMPAQDLIARVQARSAAKL